jgi:hypothetical protein
MSNDQPMNDTNTAAWTFQVWASFAIAFGMTAIGTWALPVDGWAKGYMAMAELFLVGSTFTLAKTVRDNAETRRLRNRISAAKTDKLLKEYELHDAA